MLITFQFNSLDDQIAADVNRQFIENRYNGCGAARPRYAISNAGGPALDHTLRHDALDQRLRIATAGCPVERRKHDHDA